GLRPRLEYLPATAPDVEPALARAGFSTEGRPPLLVCAPGDLRAVPVPDGIVCELAADREVLRQVLAVQHEAYGESAPPTGHDLDRMVRHVERGGLTGLARDTAADTDAGGAATREAAVARTATEGTASGGGATGGADSGGA